MEENFTRDNVRERLLFSGLKELESHGIADFSLRRVAQDAGVSCAAPYRHFRDKEELITSVVRFVLEGWTLLAKNISEIFSADTKAFVTELSVAGLRFWVANGNFRTVIMVCSSSASDGGPLVDFNRTVTDAVEAYCREHGTENSSELTFKILSMIFGAVMLVDGGCESADTAAANLRHTLMIEL